MEEKHTPSAKDAQEKTIGEFVAEDYRTAQVFEKYGIDFCCGGKAPLSETCRQKGINLDAILLEIEAAKSELVERGRDYVAWALPFLADYIINSHHGYLNTDFRVSVSVAVCGQAPHGLMLEVASGHRDR